MFKACTQCGQDKPLHHYHIDTTGRFGRKARCRICRNMRRKREREAVTLDGALEELGPSVALVAEPDKPSSEWRVIRWGE